MLILVFLAGIYATLAVACAFSWLSPAGLWLFLSLYVGHLATAVFARVRIPKGQRLSFFRSHAFDLSMDALLSVLKALFFTLFIGIPVDLFFVWLFRIPFDSPAKYRLLGVLFLAIYSLVFLRALRSAPSFEKSKQ